MEATDQTGDDEQQALSGGSQIANPTSCESHHLQSKSSSISEESMYAKRTEASIREFDSAFDNILKSKSYLLGQFALEKDSLIDKYEKSILAMRKKHKLCEDGFKEQIETAKHKYKELEERKAVDLKSFRDQISLKDSEIAENKKQAELIKQNLENVIEEKEKAITTLENENAKLHSNEVLLSDEIKNKKREFEAERNNYLANQAEDHRKIEDLKKQLSSCNVEVQKLNEVTIDLNSKYSESQENCFKLEEDLKKIREQLQVEENAKHDKIKMVQSLTVSLDESKNKIEELRKNVAELETETENRMNDIKTLQTQLISQKASFEKSLDELNEEKRRVEGKHQEETAQLKETIEKTQNECEFLKSSLEEKTSKFMLSEETLQTKLGRLEEQIKELDNNLSEVNVNYHISQEDLKNAKTLLRKAQEELIKERNDLKRANEEVGQLKVKYSSSQSQLEELKEKYETEKVARLEKSSQIVSSLKEQLLSSQSEADQLRMDRDRLNRSQMDMEATLKELRSYTVECTNALSEVENKRHELKANWDSEKLTVIELQHKLSVVENEVEHYKNSISKLSDSETMLKNELYSTGRTLYQLKLLNEQLQDQISSLKKRNTSMESEERSKYNVSQQQSLYSSERKDAELHRVKLENDELREQMSNLEREKRRVERSYVNLEKEFTTSSLRSGGSTQRPVTAYGTQHSGRTPSPATTVSVATNTTTNADHLSSLSISRLLSSDHSSSYNTTGASSTKVNFSKLTRGLEQLEQHHTEIQQKVLGLENLIESASSESDLNTTRHSAEEFNAKMTETGSVRSATSGGHLDYNGNLNEAEKRLKMAQIRAQNLIDASSNFEEIITESKSSRSRSQSLLRHNSPRPTEGDSEQEVM